MTRTEWINQWKFYGTQAETLAAIYDTEIAPLLERIAEKDRTIARRDEQIACQQGEIKRLGEQLMTKANQISFQQGEIARQDAYIESLEQELRKLKEGWKTVDVPMPPLPKRDSDKMRGWDLAFLDCIAAIYRAHGWKP